MRYLIVLFLVTNCLWADQTLVCSGDDCRVTVVIKKEYAQVTHASGLCRAALGQELKVGEYSYTWKGEEWEEGEKGYGSSLNYFLSIDRFSGRLGFSFKISTLSPGGELVSSDDTEREAECQLKKERKF